MEWQRGRSYGQDLRDKMFAAIDRGMTPGAVASAFAVSVSWIYKASARRRETGEIRARIAAVPDMTIGELRAWMLATYGVSVGHAVMWETLRRLKLTLKKRPGTPPNRRARTSRRRVKNGALGSPA
jgi:transposase